MLIGRKTFLAAAALFFSAGFAAAETITVYKTPWCGCCNGWIQAVRQADYDVKVVDLEDLAPVRARLGVPEDMESCHVSVMGDYFIEGHVPLDAIARLQTFRPEVAGIAVPGMPEGALGMEGDNVEPYEVFAIPKTPGSSPWVFQRSGG